MYPFVLDLFGDVAYGRPPKLPSGIYFYCSRCEKRCGPLEAGCEDDSGNPYCAACTRRMWTESEPDDELARNPDFLNPNVRRFNACMIRKLFLSARGFEATRSQRSLSNSDYLRRLGVQTVVEPRRQARSADRLTHV